MIKSKLSLTFKILININYIMLDITERVEQAIGIKEKKI